MLYGIIKKTPEGDLLRKLLIAENSEAFRYALEKTFENEFEIRTCQDGRAALELLSTYRPDALILNLMLSYKDGLTVLQEADCLPPVILGITHFMNDYIAQRAIELGVGYLLITPCLSAVRARLMDLLEKSRPLQKKEDPSNQAATYLRRLKFPTHLDGYQQLCVGIPLFAADPAQRLTKELYPAIAASCGNKDHRVVEHSIRSVIKASWKNRDAAVWEQYFPGIEGCPSNKVFIARFAELIEK